MNLLHDPVNCLECAKIERGQMALITKRDQLKAVLERSETLTRFVMEITAPHVQKEHTEFDANSFIAIARKDNSFIAIKRKDIINYCQQCYLRACAIFLHRELIQYYRIIP